MARSEDVCGLKLGRTCEILKRRGTKYPRKCVILMFTVFEELKQKHGVLLFVWWVLYFVGLDSLCRFRNAV